MENKYLVHVKIDYSDNEGNMYTIKAPVNKEYYFREVLAQLGYHIDHTSYYHIEVSIK